MPDPSARPVRLVRSRSGAGVPVTTGSPVPEEAEGTAPNSRRRFPNRAATQRVRRLSMFYLVVLAALYLGFALLARNSAGGATAGTAQDLELFGGVAFAFALGGVILTLLSAPVALEATPTMTVLVSPFGTRRAFPSGPNLSIRVVRRYPAGLLAGEPVESVEIASQGVRRTYLIDAAVIADAGLASA
ncbi:MAG: hypothetical protein WBG19_04305 [Thermoplasmata archaeon]